MPLAVLAPPPSTSAAAAAAFFPLSLHGPRSSASHRLLLLLGRWTSPLVAARPNSRSSVSARAYSDGRDGDERGTEESSPSLLSEELLRRVSAAKDADQALDIVAEGRESGGSSVVGIDDCRVIIEAAYDRGDADLALSVFGAMRSGFDRGMLDKVSTVERWTWARPDVRIYALMVQRLAALLRVSDAMRIIADVSRMGVSSGEEVPFGMVVRCPSCMVAVAVVQPQHGVQVFMYVYKLLFLVHLYFYRLHLVPNAVTSMSLFQATSSTLSQKRSGNAPDERSVDISPWEKALRFLQINKDSIPAALHSIVICTPSGIARTHKFATQTVELPAQEGERVTISLAAPSTIYKNIGPFKLNTRPPGFSSGEPMCLTNHINGKMSRLLRTPAKNGSSFFINPYILLPSLALLSSGDAMSAIIDPNLPKLIAAAAVASVALETTMNRLVLPEMRKLPQRTVDVVALKQQLLSQYDLLQTRIKELRQAAEKEVWLLARMCQLENKIVAIGEPSYRSRRSRVNRVQRSLEGSLSGRIELIDSYAKISSMIEIEVEMDSDVLAAEAVSNAESIAQQIQQIMEIENLEERWRLQAEANDEVERLLGSQETYTELV